MSRKLPLLLLGSMVLALRPGAQPAPTPFAIDPQRVQDQDTTSWADYRPIPGTKW